MQHAIMEAVSLDEACSADAAYQMDPEQSHIMARVALHQASEYGQLPMEPEQPTSWLS